MSYICEARRLCAAAGSRSEASGSGSRGWSGESSPWLLSTIAPRSEWMFGCPHPSPLSSSWCQRRRAGPKRTAFSTDIPRRSPSSALLSSERHRFQVPSRVGRIGPRVANLARFRSIGVDSAVEGSQELAAGNPVKPARHPDPGAVNQGVAVTPAACRPSSGARTDRRSRTRPRASRSARTSRRSAERRVDAGNRFRAALRSRRHDRRLTGEPGPNDGCGRAGIVCGGVSALPTRAKCVLWEVP